MSPLLSVIIPVYNAEKHLRRCLDSICRQTYKNLEIICVNDGSTDHSLEILQEYAANDSRFIILNQENTGQATARNRAIAASKGEWLTGIDADDYIELDTYSHCFNNLSKCKEEVPMIVFGYSIEYAETGKTVRTEPLPVRGLVAPTTRTIYATRCYFWNKLWRADLLRDSQVSFPEGMWFEDVAIFYQIAPYLSKILYLPEQKYHYLRYEGGNSSIDQLSEYNPRNIERIVAADIALKRYSQVPLPPHMRSVGKGMLEMFYNQLILHLNPQNQADAWSYLRQIVDNYHLLDDISSTPMLALQYYTPPCAIVSLNKLYVRKWELQSKTDTLLIYNDLLRQYRKAKLLKYITLGKTRKHYKQKYDKLRTKIREARALRKSIYEKHIGKI